MDQKSRTRLSLTNAAANIITQFVVLLISFATRKIFIVSFGENYLGISGLYSNILSVLSLAEFGVGNAILYCLYKPVAENDHKHINALINYYKKLYRIIGIIVAGVGLLIVPLLGYLVKIEAPREVWVYFPLQILRQLLLPTAVQDRLLHHFRCMRMRIRSAS